MCCFSLDEQTYNLNSNFLDFDVFRWGESEVQTAIGDITNYRLNNELVAPKSSYLSLFIAKVLHQHKVFLVVEGILLIVAMVVLTYFYFSGVFK